MICKPTWKCLELDTPDSILNEGNDYFEPGTDIFEEISQKAGVDFTYIDLMIDALWWRYRNWIIGACNTPDWVQGMADRLNMVGPRWEDIFSKMVNTDLTDLTDRSYDRTIQRTAIPNTEGDVTTHHYEHENLPQTIATTTKYLDARSDDKNSYVPNTQDTEHYDEHDTLNARTFADMVKAYPNVLIDFTNEFMEYFVARWYR